MKLPKILRGSSAHPPVTPAPHPRCAAIRYNGKRCTLPAGPDGYCGQWNHTARAQTSKPKM